MFDKIILSNSVGNYCIVFGIIIFALLIKRFLSHSIASLLFLLIHKKWTSIEKRDFIALTLKPLSYFLVISIAIFSLGELQFPEAWSIKIHGILLSDIIEKAGNTIFIISFFYFVISFIDFVALLLELNISDNSAKDKSHDQVVIFFRDLLKVVIVFVGLLFILRVAFNQDIGSLLTGLSIVGAALALAAKESIENLIASFIIFFDKPFFTGDTVKVNNITGTVEHIGLRSTRIRTGDKTLVTVPNKQMVDSVVDNWSMRTERRAEIILELNNETPSAATTTFIQALEQLLANEKTFINSAHVYFTDLNKNACTIKAEYFTAPIALSEFNLLKQQINTNIKKVMEAQQIKFASNNASS